MNIQCRGASRSFAKETRALKMRSVVTSHWGWQWPTESRHQSWSSYKYPRSCLRTPQQPFYGHSAFWKCSTNGCLLGWPKIEKLSFYSTQHQWTISQSNCDVWWKVDFMWNQQWPAQWLDQEEVPKHFPKPNLHPTDPLQLSESWRNHYIWEVGSATWWDALKTAMPAARTGLQNGPNSSPWQCLTAHRTTNTPKVEQIGLQTFASSATFTWHLVNRLPLLQASRQFFVGKMLPPPAGGKKCFPRVQSALNHGFLCYRNKNLFLIGRNVLIVMVAILINKDGFESSYNELKFTVQTHNYFCTNLIQSLPGRSQSSFNYVDHSQICTASPCSLLFLKLLTPLENYLPNISTCLSLRHLKFNLSKRKLLTFLLC